MHRRSFLKGAAALAGAPAAVLAKPVPAAIPSAIDVSLGTVTAGLPSIGARLEICQHGMRIIDAGDVVRVAFGVFGESGELGPIQKIVPIDRPYSA